MSGDVVIRRSQPGDADAMVEIAIAAWAPFFDSLRALLGKDLFSALHPDWEREKAGEIRRACEGEGGAQVAVAEKGGRVVGFITLYPAIRPRMGGIGNNAVHPNSQGVGIGTRMYEYALQRLREEGVRFVEVSTGADPFHAPARRAYEKAGFSVQFPGVTYYQDLSARG